MFLVCLSLNLIILMGVIVANICEKDQCDKANKRNLLLLFLPLVHQLMKYLPITMLYHKEDKLKESLQQLQVSEKGKELFEEYIAKKLSLVILIFFVMNTLCCLSELNFIGKIKLLEGKYIKSSVLLQDKVNLEAYVSEINDKHKIKRYLSDYVVELNPEVKNLNTIPEKVLEVKDQIKNTLLGENDSYEKIYHSLNMAIKTIDSEVKIEWEIDPKDYVNADGSVNNIDLIQAVEVKVTALLLYQGVTYRYAQPMLLLPYQQYLDQQLQHEVKESLTKAIEKSEGKEYLVLPEVAKGYEITWKEKKESRGLSLFFLGILLSITIFFAQDYEVKKKIKIRNHQMVMDYPEIVNKFTLLLRAGMTVSGAFTRITEDYNAYEKSCSKKKKQTKRYAYEEMQITYQELKLGKSEIEAYESFGKRIKLLPYMRFSSLVSQNVKKGTKELIHLLELEAIEALSERKELAKRLGEEAGTKLLAPMLGMLIIVLVIIMVPAFLSF